MQFRILRILNRFNVGGPIYNVGYLSKHLPSNFETRLIAGNIEPFEANANYVLDDLGLSYEIVPNMHRSINLINDYKAFRQISKIIKEFKPDIIHTHAAKAGALGRLAGILSSHKVKVIVHTYHGNVFDGYFSLNKTRIFLAIERFLAKKSSAIIAISKKQKQDLSDIYKIDSPEKIHVVPLGFDLSRFTHNSIEKRKYFRNSYNLSEDTHVITITGRLTEIKNHSFLLEALSWCKQRTKKKIKLFIVGDGELKLEIIEKSKSLNFTVSEPENIISEADIILTSWRKDIDVINAGSDIVALTSLNEGTPVSIIEAMASSKAVISTNVGGVSDIIDDGVNGLIRPLIVEEYGQGLLQLIENNELRNSLSKNAAIKVLKEYHYTRLVSDIEKIYTHLLEK